MVVDANVDARSESPEQRLQRIAAWHRNGEFAACMAELDALARASTHGPADLLERIGQHYTALGRHREAERCYAQACAMQPQNAEFLYNYATALIALGRLNEAGDALDQVIAARPHDGDAWYNRSTLRRQTAQRNHIDAIRRRLAAAPDAASARIALNYALAKELEDVGDHAASFAALRAGADQRRAALSYRVEDDLGAMRSIAQAFDAPFFSAKHVGHADPRPLFVIGLPRSGTTLVERILSSHGSIAGKGESGDLAMAVVHATGAAAGKEDRIRRATQVDFAALGERYCASLPPAPALRWIDKTPNNFLYLGIVAQALPEARIVHVRRHPLDACYAMYKTLFRMAYPYSYDLDDLARYWLGYRELMAHWRSVLPRERFLEVDYEDLVENQEAVSRRLVAHAGLEWDARCLAFERNAEPSLTASAAQVRQPIYRSSVGLWRRYERELAPLRERLAAAGVVD